MKIARGLAVGVTFLSALVAGVLLHENTPAFRRMGAEVGNRALAGLFEGRIAVTHLTHLDLGRRSSVRIDEANVYAPDGSLVIRARGIDASIDLVTLFRSLLVGGAPVVELPAAEIASADVTLDQEGGTPKIAKAFKVRAPTTAAAPAPDVAPAGPRRDPMLHIRRARIASAHVHGDLVPPALDGDARAIEATVSLEHDVVTTGLERADVVLRKPRLPNQKADVAGIAHGKLAVTLATTRLDGEVDFTGTCAGVPVTARATIAGDDVTASLDVARSTLTDALDVPVSGVVELHARATGTLPVLRLTADARVGEATALGSATVDVRAGTYAFEVDARHVDLRAYGVSVASDLGAKVHGEGAGGLGTFAVESEAGTIAGQRIPAAKIDGRLEADRVTAEVRAEDRGVGGSGTIDLDRTTFVAKFDVTARTRSLHALHPSLAGAATVRARGTFDVLRQTVRANATVNAQGVSADIVSAKTLTANGTIAGPITAPSADVAFTGTDLALTAKGKAPLVYPEARGHARLALAPTPHIVDASVELASGGAPVRASAQAIRWQNGAIETRGVVVEGLGDPLALDVQAGAGQWRVRAKTAGIDLKRLAALTGVKELALVPGTSRAELDIDVEDAGRGADGRFDVVVRSEKALGEGALVTEAHGTVVRGKLDARAKLTAEGLGELEVLRAQLELPPGLALDRATGTVELRGSVDLSQGAALLGGEGIERVAGIARFEARLERGDPAALPAVRATVRTDGLEVVYGDPASKAPPLEVVGVDGLVHVAWDGHTDDAEVAALAWDRRGLLVSGGGKSRLPLATWMKERRVALGGLDVDATLMVPRRQLSELPAFLGLGGLRGQADARASVGGTLLHPRAAVHVGVSNLRENRSRDQRSFDPLDGALDARWDGQQAAITLSLDERQVQRKRGPRGKEPVPGHLRALMLVTDARMSDILAGKSIRELPWKASTELELENLNLAALPIAGLQGALTGRVQVRDIHAAPSFQATAHVAGFGAGGAKVQRVDVTAGGRDGSLFAHAVVQDDSSTEPTRATFQLASQSLRIRGLHVDWDEAAPTRLDYAVVNGRLALLAPLLRSTTSELSGRADGAGSISIDGDGEIFDGGLAVSDVRLYVNALGEEIAGASAVARFEKSGAWRIDDATGKMGSGEFHAQAAGRLKGFSFVDAEATVRAPRGIPLSSDSATFAEATGEFKVSAKMSEDRSAVLVTVDIPKANVSLPDRGTQQLEPLEPDPTIVVGVRRKAQLDTSVVKKGLGGTGRTRGSAKAPSGEPLVFKVTVDLGGGVHLEGRGLDVALGGKALVELAEELSVTGRIDLKGGTIEVHGRRFVVDRGVVTFPEGGAPDNPTVVAAAYWDAPDRTRVWVEFTGPLKSGTLALRSEPAYSKTEILSVLLFGRADPNVASGSPDKTGASAVGSGFVAGDLNRMLSELDENLDIETDTLSGNRARTKLGRSFFDRRLKVQVGYAPGKTYREPDTTYLFVNWQFIPKWSIVATRGNAGTSILDVLFQHRY